MRRSLMHKLLSLLLLLSSASAFAAKDGGTVYICANKDNSIKLTADLSDQKFNQVAVVMVDGVSKLFHGFNGRTRRNLFLMGAVKNSTLQIRRDAKSPNRVSLDTNPEGHAQVAHEGAGVTVTKFEATLTVPELQIATEAVSCLETRWSD